MVRTGRGRETRWKVHTSVLVAVAVAVVVVVNGENRAAFYMYAALSSYTRFWSNGTAAAVGTREKAGKKKGQGWAGLGWWFARPCSTARRSANIPLYSRAARVLHCF